jgi:hypothetical protein
MLPGCTPTDNTTGIPRPLVLGKPPPKPHIRLHIVLLSDTQFDDSQPVPPVMSLSFLEPLPTRALLLKENLPKHMPGTVIRVVAELGTLESERKRKALMDATS